ncbi:MAG: orotate phosphoribosyltransferase [Buchnera aphidicola (Periphyllus lyropictus)]|uniref:orotate phosphoribosyltransferase n=1 Tax=Buchnera aphidicola TaxID=9 RepID=UPI001EC4D2C9|nr:orotate phosphoribosyltransferase [Buchnera aphidicola]NIH16860.1 orotate phosphoribosyltransferase [Buchnera aphidicola (Periphyllus lyropictus)]USS94729.1 orotate phosphoribosyltransferase [Buchnera aphidicola (Periphyllus lyropictus)]
MKEIKKKFIKFILKKKILIFGNFILKSKIKSPYFFNISSLSTGKDLYTLGKFYAKTLIKLNIKFDSLFGIAYKGIPILIATVIALKNKFNINVPYSFNRKETKTYGEKGNIVGNLIKGKIIIIDDVFTSGTAIKNAIKIIKKYKDIKIKHILLSLDRKEFKELNLSKNKRKKNSFQISSIININDIIHYLKKKNIMKKELKILIKHKLKKKEFEKTKKFQYDQNL